MRILFLTFYYPPDLSAGSFRAVALVDALRKVAGPDLHIDVLTTQPNRYHSFATAVAEKEEFPNLSLRRFSLPRHRSGMVDQALAFTAYARRVMAATSGGHWDAVVATSSRLMTAVLGARVARRINAPLYLDIRDLFIDTMTDLLAGKPLAHILPVFRSLERRTFRAARRINVVSAGFLPDIRALVPDKEISVFTNGIDDEFLAGGACRAVPPRTEGALPLILYAGNIGEGQGLHSIVPEAARRLAGRARFRIIGGGGRHEALSNALSASGVTNVDLCPPVSRSELAKHYAEADILFLHLNDHAAFRKVLPSKVFEYAATGKPLLAGVAGHAASFIQSEIAGAEVFAPCDAEGFMASFEQVEGMPERIERGAFLDRYARRRVMEAMALDIVEMARETGA